MDNSDDYDFTPSASSKLASLFGSTSPFSEDSNLTYTAPKQPRPDTKPEPASAPSADSSVICARVVQVWKLTDGKYIPLGKLGLAIIGSSTHNTYEMILYKDKRNVIIRIRITQAFEVFLKKDSFVSFYDSSQDNWLVKFSSDEDCTVIINHVERYGGKVSTHVETEKTDHKNHENTAEVFSESFENKAKVDILSRIAKMGQSILPSKTEPDDDSTSTDSNETKISENQLVSPTRSVQPIPNTFVMGQPMPYDPLNLYFTENRTQNTEIRMNLTQISEKLNNLMKAVGNEKSSDSETDTLKSKIKGLRLTNENLSRELGKMQEENQKLKTRISQEASLKQAVEDSKLELRLAKEREETTTADIMQQLSLYKNTVEELSRRVEDLEQILTEKEESVNVLQAKLADYQKRANDDKNVDFIAVLKNTMNGMYGNIVENIQNEQNSAKINSIIAQNIKSTTLNIIQNFQNYVTPPELK